MSLTTRLHRYLEKRRRRRLAGEIDRLRHCYRDTVESVESIRKKSPGFEEVRHEVRCAGTASLAHFGNQYTHDGGFYLQQNPDEFAALALFLRQRRPIATYLEIGSASGGACLFLSQTVGFGQVFSLDDGQHPNASLQDRHFGQIPNSQRFLGDSHSDQARVFLKQHVTEPLDVVFIDGDHSHKGVEQDVELTIPYCRRGAWVIFHDTVACDGVAQAWCDVIRHRVLAPRAEFIGSEKPLGIGVGEVL